MCHPDFNIKTYNFPHGVVPLHIIKYIFDIIGPSIQVIIGSCLAPGTVPACFKHAVNQPLFKKQSTDVNCPNSYCPISKLPLVSQSLEKLGLSQLLPSLNLLKRKILRILHSNETALLKMTNDLLYCSH